MDYEINDWQERGYNTGRTCPPKNHGGLIAVLLILVIFLTGIISVLSILNIRLFRELSTHSSQELPISFQAAVTEPTEAAASAQEQPRPFNEDVTIPIETSPESAANIREEGGLSLQEIYSRNIPSVVSILSRRAGGSGTGTGVVLSGQGYIVTNFHVVENSRELSVQLTDGRSLPAEIVGSDSISDLAVLFIDAQDLTPACFGDSEKLRVGDSVVAIGDPLGIEFRGTMTDGIVSAINRDVAVNGRTLNLIQTNAALNSGNSGGPLINCYGQVIGINTMKIGTFTDDAGVEGLGFAIPSATVKDIVSQLISQGYVSGRPYLGVSGEGMSAFYQHFYHAPAGLHITDVAPGSPADSCGIEPGDILMRIDETLITDSDTLSAVLYGYQVGDTVELTVYRGGYQATVQVTLAEATG